MNRRANLIGEGGAELESSVGGAVPELGLNAQELVVLGEALRAARGPGLELAGGQTLQHAASEAGG